MKCTKPLVIVNNLNGTGVNPAIAKRDIHAITPPSEDTLSFKNETLSTPYNSKIFKPISLKKTYPIKYPKQAPKTEPIRAVVAIFIHWFGYAIVIGIIKTSGGTGNIKLSTKEIIPNKTLDFLWDASWILLL